MKPIKLTTPQEWAETFVNEDKLNECLRKTEAQIEIAKGRNFHAWPIIVISEDWNKALRNAVAQRYIDFGWHAVVHYTSEEKENLPGLTTFVLLTKEMLQTWHENNQYAQKFDYTIIKMD